MQVISGAMLAAVALMLGMSVFLRQTMKPAGIPLVGWLAAAVAVLSPLVASVSTRATVAPSGDRGPVQSPAVTHHLVAFAILEAAAFLCGVAVIVGPGYLPLVAAAVPVGAMILRFPRAS
jgi:hypothetical protein